MSNILNPGVLQGNDNIPGNEYAYYLTLDHPWFMSKGAMIAYYGQASFNAFTAGMAANLQHMVRARSARRCTSRTSSWSRVTAR